MIPCSHCHEEHSFAQIGWPENWNQNRRMEFYQRMSNLGVLDQYIPGMACEIERLLLVSPYRVSEFELYRYFESTNTTHRRFLDLLDRQSKWAAHCKKSLSVLCPTEKNSCLVGICWIFIFVFVTLAVYVATIPVRVSFAVRLWWVKRQICPLFIGWLERHGVKK